MSYFREYKKLLRFIKPHFFTLIVAVICMGFSAIFSGISLGMIIPISDRVLTDKKIIIPAHLPPFLENLVNTLNNLSPYVVLKIIGIAIIILFFLKGLFSFLQNYFMNVLGQSVVYDTRNRLFAKFQELSLDFYTRKRTGELISRITNDVGLITNALSYGLTDLIYQTMQIIIFTFLVFYIHWKMAFISLVVFPIIIFPVLKIGKRIKKISHQIQRKMADLNSFLSETISGAYIVKAFCREDYEVSRFKEINHSFFKFTVKAIKRTLFSAPFTEFIGALVAVIILLIAGREVIEAKISFGVFGLFMAALLSMIRPFKKLSTVYSINQNALAASARIYEVLEEKPTVIEEKSAREIKQFQEYIQFRNVWFKYSESDNFVLKDINFKVQKKEVVALVGHSGAGKSTLLHLLPRLYDPTKGEIIIDGVNIKKVTLKSLRSLMAVVSQEMILFNATVEENLRYAREDASWEEIIDATKKAYAYEFIQNLPQGFNTIIGDKGARLSGGEKQRLAIARAILKNSPILIFDEVTSQLDSHSEQKIKEVLYSLMREKTVFVIAHRLSTVQKADRILLLDEGRIIEEGTHTSLISRDSLYRKLYELQFSV